MTPEERKARYEGLNSRITALLNEYKDILGPEQDENGDLCTCGGDPCPCKVPEGYMTTEWVVVTNWADLGSLEGGVKINQDWMHTECSLGMRRTQIMGLLLGSLDTVRGIR